ncbi:hypothetical protein FP2506_01080 [Fulvimarina pelagi HTCC2506]|uniref:Uncharacterized protein n=1 Tax=Fulvimarina pelagi HTCC2506 TaxID=314231 RepID=Q0G281_9HYPH|nr:hypothetical protein FP2506_01080 [Fulvimarina pelagi HTCC2506]
MRPRVRSFAYRHLKVFSHQFLYDFVGVAASIERHLLQGNFHVRIQVNEHRLSSVGASSLI